MKRGNERKKGNNNVFTNQYSHRYAKVHYSKKLPKDLKENIILYLSELYLKYSEYRENTFTIEGIAKKFEVIHKHINNVIQELQKEGVVQRINEPRYYGAQLIPSFTKHDYSNDAWHDGARHPKIFKFDPEKIEHLYGDSVFGKGQYKKWLDTRIRALGNMKPSEVSRKERMIILGRIEHGIVS